MFNQATDPGPVPGEVPAQLILFDSGIQKAWGNVEGVDPAQGGPASTT